MQIATLSPRHLEVVFLSGDRLVKPYLKRGGGVVSIIWDLSLVKRKGIAWSRGEWIILKRSSQRRVGGGRMNTAEGLFVEKKTSRQN